MLNNILATAKTILESKEVNNLRYGQGTIQGVDLSNGRPFVLVQFKDDVKKFDLQLSLKNNNLGVTKEVKTACDDIINCFNSIREEQAKAELKERADLLEQQAAKRREIEQEIKERKEQEKFEKCRKAAVEKFESMTNKEYTIVGAAQSYYYAIGWLAANIRTIFARLPDYLDDAFSSHFGTDAPRNLVNTGRKTIGGYKPQWTYAFSASLKNVEQAPTFVLEHLNEKQTKISDTALIWNLVDNHQFKFGKIQDVSIIRETIPGNMLEYFDLGYSS